jgi:hypothetical protein
MSTPFDFLFSIGYERMMHTEEGKKRSREYNENIYEQTIRHAMIGQLRHPRNISHFFCNIQLHLVSFQ